MSGHISALSETVMSECFATQSAKSSRWQAFSSPTRRVARVQQSRKTSICGRVHLKAGWIFSSRFYFIGG